MENKLADKIIKILSETLSRKRYIHSLNVAKEAEKLAVRYGADVEKCYFAGLLHDIKKEEQPNLMKQQALLNPFKLEEVELDTKALWHAPASAYFAYEKLGVCDMEIIGAVRWHTVGKPDMSLTEKVVYLADLVSADRMYEDVAIMRKIAYTDIDYAMYVAMKMGIIDVLDKNGMLAISSIEAYNFYSKFNKKESI